jgi:23S rRNA (adenine2503-C2)-methyltransferase
MQRLARTIARLLELGPDREVALDLVSPELLASLTSLINASGAHIAEASAVTQCGVVEVEALPAPLTEARARDLISRVLPGGVVVVVVPGAHVNAQAAAFKYGPCFDLEKVHGELESDGVGALVMRGQRRKQPTRDRIKELKGIAHNLEASILIGMDGLSEGLVASAREAIGRNGLIQATMTPRARLDKEDMADRWAGHPAHRQDRRHLPPRRAARPARQTLMSEASLGSADPARPNVHGLTPEALTLHLADVGCTLAHARSLMARTLSHPAGSKGRTPANEKVPARVRAAFVERVDHRGLDVVETAEDPDDGFVKLLLRSPDGALSEAVRIPLEKEGAYTTCLSSQVGCAMGCTFCATGRLGLTRSLATWEMVAAFSAVRDRLPEGGRLTGAVFMGQGEPLHNYDAVIGAAQILSSPTGGRLRAENISISTVGLVPAMRRYTAEGHRFRLVVSLTSAIPERRRSLLPITRRYGLPELAEAIREYTRARGERMTLAWVLIGGVNDGADEVDALRALLGDTPYKLNLIDVNADEREFPRTSPEGLARFRDQLRALGQPVVRRYSGGRNRHAACGMLASREADQNV